MDEIRTAVVGAGKMGAIHSKVYDQLPGCRLVAIVDPVFEKAERLAEQYGCQAYSNCEDILDKVDAVTIAAPTIYHLELAKLLIKNKLCLVFSDCT